MAHTLDKYHPRKNSLVSHAVETVEYGAASFGFGYIQNRYRKANIAGVPADILSGLAFKAVALAMDMKGGAMMERIAPHLNVVGNAGVGAFFHTLGAGAGMKHAGIVRMALPAGTNPQLAASKVPGSVILGGIAPAPKGDFLTSAELAAMAR